MKKIVFAFKKDAKGFVSWAIRFVTKSQDGLSHVEVYFPDTGLSFSSREPKGTSFQRIDYTDRKVKWIFVEFEISEEDYLKVLQLCHKYDNLPYDFLGILRLYVNKSVENMKQFCSEIAGRVAKTIKKASRVDPNRTSPQRLFDVLAADPDSKVTNNYE